MDILSFEWAVAVGAAFAEIAGTIVGAAVLAVLALRLPATFLYDTSDCHAKSSSCPVLRWGWRITWGRRRCA
jgi:hypothetical protein